MKFSETPIRLKDAPAGTVGQLETDHDWKVKDAPVYIVGEKVNGYVELVCVDHQGNRSEHRYPGSVWIFPREKE